MTRGDSSVRGLGDAPFDDGAAERLLAGDGDGPLRHLLSAAQAPGTAQELAGEEAALAAFRTALSPQRAPSGAPRNSRAPRKAGAADRRLPFLPRGLAVRRLVAVKLGLAAAVLGGVAFAATAGYLPNPLAPAPDTSAVGSSRPPGSTGPATGSASPHPTITPAVVQSGLSTAPGPAAVPTIALPGLCRSYLAHIEAKPDTPWGSPLFASLSALAGGDDQVPAYCSAVVAADGEAHPSAVPSTGPSIPATNGAQQLSSDDPRDNQ